MSGSRIVLASTAAVPGGVLRHVSDLAGGLMSAGWRVSLCGRADAAPVRDLAAGLGVDLMPLGSTPRPGVVFHLHLADTYEPGARELLRRWRQAGARIVVTEHLPRTNASDRTLSPERSKPGAQRYKTVRKHRQYAPVDRVIAVSGSSAEFLSARYRLPEHLVAVVENGLPTDDFTAGRRFEDRSGVIAVGSLIAQKGHDRLIRAAGASAGRWPLTLVGTGPQRESLERLAEEVAPGRVRFTGWLTEPGEAVGRSRAAVLPSRWESFPYAVGEARSVGTPVIGAPVDGIVDQIEDGVTGVLADPDDPAAFAAAIDRVVGDPVLWERLRAGGLEHAAQFSLKRMVEATEQVYESVLGEGMPLGVR